MGGVGPGGGAPLAALTVIVTDADTAMLELSVAVTVSTCVPVLKSSVGIRAAAVAAIWPSMLLVQVIAAASNAPELHHQRRAMLTHTCSGVGPVPRPHR